MNGLTQGALTLRDIDITDEAFFYTPSGDDPFFAEPVVFSIKHMMQAIAPTWDALADGKKPAMPPGLELCIMPIIEPLVRHLWETGAAERPLVDEAQRNHVPGMTDGVVCFVTSPTQPKHYPLLIDGTHRYIAAHERGETKVVAAVMEEVFYRQFMIGGLPAALVEDMQGVPGESVRFNEEKRWGIR